MRIREVIVVEGRYDVNTVKQAVDATVISTGGFGIFNDREQQALLRRLALKRGLIVLTDSDSAGFVIRNFLRGSLPRGAVKHAYIPQRPGKERRKTAPGREGLLGVEGMDPETLRRALLNAGATVEGESLPAAPTAGIKKAELMALGLSGTPDSAANRQKLLRALDLPDRMTANALLEAVNLLMTREEFLHVCEKTL